MKDFELNTFFQQLDLANGESEILPLMNDFYEYSKKLDEDSQKKINAEFNYYFAKRFAKFENELEIIKSQTQNFINWKKTAA